MSCLLISINKQEDLQKLDKYFTRQSDHQGAFSESFNIKGVCVNILQNNMELHDASLKYLVEHDIQGEIVYEKDIVSASGGGSDLIKYVKSTDLDIYNVDKFIKIDPVTGKEEYILASRGINNIQSSGDMVSFPDCDLFALAEKYKSEKQFQKAIECYNKTLYETKYHEQYKYLACLYMGQISTENTDRLKYFLLGISYDHERVECYYELVVLENCRGNNQKAAFYGLLCPIEQLDEPRNPDMKKPHVNPMIYKYLFDINLGVACYYANLKKEGYYATLRALKGAADEHQRKVAISNLKYYNEITKEMPYRPELLVVDNFYPDAYKLVQKIFQTNRQTKEYENIELLVNDHAQFIVKPKVDMSVVRGIFNKIFNTDVGEICASSGLINLKGGYMSNWVNYTNKHKWNVIVFLQPSSQGSSLELLQHTPSRAKEVKSETIQTIEKDVYDTSCWSVTEKVEERFNRCIIYRGNRFFQFTKYYNGATLDSYMAYQTFCFEV